MDDEWMASELVSGTFFFSFFFLDRPFCFPFDFLKISFGRGVRNAADWISEFVFFFLSSLFAFRRSIKGRQTTEVPKPMSYRPSEWQVKGVGLVRATSMAAQLLFFFLEHGTAATDGPLKKKTKERRRRSASCRRRSWTPSSPSSFLLWRMLGKYVDHAPTPPLVKACSSDSVLFSFFFSLSLSLSSLLLFHLSSSSSSSLWPRPHRAVVFILFLFFVCGCCPAQGR